MKLTINSYHAVAEWKWNLPGCSDETCGICRVDFEGTCSKCKFPGDECPIMIGECTHCFHMHCINNWLQSEHSQGRCPMCRQVFREKVVQPPAATTNPTTPTAAGSNANGRRVVRNSSGSSGASSGSNRSN